MKKEPKYPKTLHEAVKRADLQQIRELLAAGASPNGRDSDGLPPIAYVLEHSYAVGFTLTYETREMIRLLREAGANPGLGGAREYVESFGSSMVSSSAEAADFSTFRSLLQ